MYANDYKIILCELFSWDVPQWDYHQALLFYYIKIYYILHSLKIIRNKNLKIVSDQSYTFLSRSILTIEEKEF